MGVRPLERPLERPWWRIAVHPQPGLKLAHATITVPTLRGEVMLPFARTVHHRRFCPQYHRAWEHEG